MTMCQASSKSSYGPSIEPNGTSAAMKCFRSRSAFSQAGNHARRWPSPSTSSILRSRSSMEKSSTVRTLSRSGTGPILLRRNHRDVLSIVIRDRYKTPRRLVAARFDGIDFDAHRRRAVELAIAGEKVVDAGEGAAAQRCLRREDDERFHRRLLCIAAVDADGEPSPASQTVKPQRDAIARIVRHVQDAERPREEVRFAHHRHLGTEVLRITRGIADVEREVEPRHRLARQFLDYAAERIRIRNHRRRAV